MAFLNPRGSPCVRYALRRLWTGSESFISAVRMQKFLLGSRSGLDFSIKSDAYKSDPGLSHHDGDSTSESGCPSLNQRCLPRRAVPSETLRERIDLIVMAARKRQQLGDEPFEPRSVLRQEHRTNHERVNLRKHLRPTISRNRSAD
jgi:hypothetical protein